MGNCGSEIQQSAADACLEVAKCANGDVGCTEVLPDEVEVLLDGLHAPSTAVRDVSLQVLVLVLSYSMYTLCFLVLFGASTIAKITSCFFMGCNK